MPQFSQFRTFSQIPFSSSGTFRPLPIMPFSSFQSFSPFQQPPSFPSFPPFGSFNSFFPFQSLSPFQQSPLFNSFYQQQPFSPFGSFSPFGLPFYNPFITNPDLPGGSSNNGLQGFDTSNSIINLNDLISGAKGKDSIPPLTNPEYVTATEADFLNDNDLVVGLSISGKNWAYPLKILNYHEIVNDVLEGTSVAVTWCPLTRSAIVFDREIGGETLEFGVSGYLYNNNLVMYDRDFSGLWPQLWLGAVTGKFSGQRLTLIPSKVTTWEDWWENHPNTLVLSDDTGHSRNYDIDPYQDYQSSNEIRFPMTSNIDGRLPAKSFVLGLRINNVSVAYSMDLVNSFNDPMEDEINGLPVKIFPGPNNTGYIIDDKGDLLPGILVYWFAWSAFNPNTSLAN
jgi:hypothetical protein